MRRLMLLFFICVGYSGAYSQQLLKGTVLDGGTGKAIEDASVSLLDSKQSALEYTFTDKKGAFAIRTNEAVCFLAISYLGYSKVVHAIAEAKNGQVFLLKSEEYRLKEVKIVSKRIQEKQDTLIYAVSGFKMPQDRSIADVLKKMPGIEVLPSGQIKFEDRAISKLYIEGMDLMGDRYGLATNNLSGKVVKEVQVLKNHQAIAAIRGKSFTEQAALNLVLEDAVHYTFSGSADLGGGLSSDKEGLWYARLVGLLLGKRQQNLSLYKTDNTGEDLSNEIRLQSRTEDMEVESDEPLLSMPAISVGQIDERRYLMNKDHLFATNHLYKMSEVATLRGQFTYLGRRDQMREEAASSYFYPEGTVVIAENNKLDLGTDNYAAEADYQLNDSKMYIRNRFVGNMEKSSGNNWLQTNNDPVNAFNQVKRKAISNSFQLIRPLSSGHIVKLMSKQSFSDLPQRLTVSPGLYEDVINEGKPYESFTQELNLRTFRSHIASELQFKVAGFYTNLQVGVDYSNQQLRSSLLCKDNDESLTSVPAFYNDLSFMDTRIYATPSLQFKNQYWNIRFRVPLSFHQYQLNDKESEPGKDRHRYLFAEPSLNAVYELNAYWNVSNTLNFHYQVPDINRFYSNYIFTTYRNASSGNKFYYQKMLTEALTLKYNNPLNGFFWSLSGVVAPTWQNNILSSSQDGILTTSEMVDLKHRNLNWNLRTRVSKTFGFWKLFTGFTASYNENRSKSLLSGELVPFTSKSISAAFDFALQPHKCISVEGSERYLRSMLSSPIIEPTSSNSFRSTLAINVFPADQWKVKLNNLWVSGSKPTPSSIYFMDAAVSYLYKQVELELNVTNIFDKKSFRQTTYSSMSEQFTLNYFHPREITAKLMISF